MYIHAVRRELFITSTGRDRMHDRLKWDYVAYYVFMHAIGLYGLWCAYAYASAAIVWFSIGYFFFGHLAITCGAHRLYSHESYHASTALQYIYVLGFSAVAQGPVVWWVGKHRQHHARTDLDGDPHSPRNGFFHAHMGWLMRERHGNPAPPQYTRHFWRGGGKTYTAALWQLRYYRVLVPAMTLGVPTLFGFIIGETMNGLLVGGFARVVVQYHLTWIVNSLGHSDNGPHGSAANHWLLAIPTVGESFHANHHERPRSYRLGSHWYDVDLGYYMIKLCMLVGLAREHQRV